MKLIEIYVEINSKETCPVYLGGIVLDCGIEIYGIHFLRKENSFYVNYPAVRDKNRKFHPSFCILDSEKDQEIKRILKDAWNRAEQMEKSVYGYFEKEGEISWTDKKRLKQEFPVALRQLPVTVSLTQIYSKTNNKEIAYGRICIEKYALINNIKIYRSNSGEINIQFPKHGKEEVVRFFSEEDRVWLEDYIIEQFQAKDSLYISNITENNNYESFPHKDDDQERLFRILWDASDNGYILQSQIRGILEKNHIDWKKKYNVQRISELIEKMEFMSARRLETKPEHFVDWVTISYEKDPESQVSTDKNGVNLPDDVKKELYEALNRKYKAEGKINLAEVIPYMQEEFPHLMGKLPKVKLKVILKSCDFVTFEGGPMPPIYIHISETDLEQEEIREIQPQNDEDQEKRWDSNQPEEDQQTELCQANLAQKKQEDFIEVQENTNKDRIEKDFHLAHNNPFTYIENTKLLLESRIPGGNLPSVNSDVAMKKLLILASSGHLDSMDLELVYWISNLQYAKSTFLYDLIIGGFIPIPPGKKISKDKLNKRLLRLYQLKLIEFYRLCSVNEEGVITNKANHRILMLTGYGRTQLKMIGRQSTFDYFMPLDNIEKILGKLSVNQWFTKFIIRFKDAFYFFDTVLTATIAEANAARISLIINKEGIPIFVRAFKRGNFHNDSVRSGEFDFWIKRVSSLLENYRELYINSMQVEYKKTPKVIFICEDLNHCYEIYQQIKDATERIGNAVVLRHLWFAEDLNIYNDFLHAHFYFNDRGDMLQANLEEFLEVKADEAIDSEPENFMEQSVEEDTKLLAELDYEEKQIEQAQSKE